MFRFANPYYFFLVIPVAIAAWLIYRRNIRSGIVFSATSRISFAGRTWRTYAASALPALYLAGLILSIIALARPQTVFSRLRRTADVIAIEMTVDCSGSMDALDMSTATDRKTRLDAVKQAFTEFIKQRPDDLCGLVTFGGFATSRVPLTTDHNALLHVLGGVHVPKEGLDSNGQQVDREEILTAIGDGLATACARLEHADPKSKIVVLLTDGVSNTGIIQPDEAMKIAKKMGIKVYTIGVGSDDQAPPFLVRDMFGREVLARQQVGGLDEELLKNIASTTGGRYFNVKDPSGLGKAMNEINKLEKTKIQRDEYRQYNELFPWFLCPAVALIALGTALNVMIARRMV
jgi:Ca-activated chloride channel family protein